MANFLVLLFGFGLSWCGADWCMRVERREMSPSGPGMCKQLCECFNRNSPPVYNVTRLSCICNVISDIKGTTEKNDECRDRDPKSIRIQKQAKCPPRFTFDRAANFCYYVDTNKHFQKTETLFRCMFLSARLAVVNTHDKLNILKNLHTQLRNEKKHGSFWVDAKMEANGLNKRIGRWPDGSCVLQTLWNPGEPNNMESNNENCVKTQEQTFGGEIFYGLNDACCYLTAYQLCEVAI